MGDVLIAVTWKLDCVRFRVATKARLRGYVGMEGVNADPAEAAERLRAFAGVMRRRYNARCIDERGALRVEISYAGRTGTALARWSREVRRAFNAACAEVGITHMG